MFLPCCLQNDLLLTQGKRDGRITVLGVENADTFSSIRCRWDIFALPFHKMKMEIKTSLNTRQSYEKHWKPSLFNCLCSSDTNIKIHCGTPSDHRKNYSTVDQNHAATLDILWMVSMRMESSSRWCMIMSFVTLVPGLGEQSTTFKVQVDTQNRVTSDISVSKRRGSTVCST